MNPSSTSKTATSGTYLFNPLPKRALISPTDLAKKSNDTSIEMLTLSAEISHFVAAMPSLSPEPKIHTEGKSAAEVRDAVPTFLFSQDDDITTITHNKIPRVRKIQSPFETALEHFFAEQYRRAGLPVMQTTKVSPTEISINYAGKFSFDKQLFHFLPHEIMAGTHNDEGSLFHLLMYEFPKLVSLFGAKTTNILTGSNGPLSVAEQSSLQKRITQSHITKLAEKVSSSVSYVASDYYGTYLLSGIPGATTHARDIFEPIIAMLEGAYRKYPVWDNDLMVRNVFAISQGNKKKLHATDFNHIRARSMQEVDAYMEAYLPIHEIGTALPGFDEANEPISCVGQAELEHMIRVRLNVWEKEKEVTIDRNDYGNYIPAARILVNLRQADHALIDLAGADTYQTILLKDAAVRHHVSRVFSNLQFLSETGINTTSAISYLSNQFRVALKTALPDEVREAAYTWANQ